MLISKKALSIDKLMIKMNSFKNFLTLATDTLIQEKIVKVNKNDRNVTVFFDRQFQNNVVDEKNIDEMNFTYAHIEEIFTSVISEWFEFSQKYKKSMTLYFETLEFQKSYPLEIEFLRIAQSLEAFHRIKYPDYKDKNFKNRIIDLVRIRNILESDECEFADKISTIRHYHSHGFLENKEKTICVIPLLLI